MSRRLFASRAFLLAFGLVFAPAARAAAQLVALRSVPVASGDQFLVYPTRRMGMGGPSIALRDSWLDPFVNPAKGALTTESAFFASPTFYGISEHNGAGRTLPLSGLFTGGAWFGGVSMALQQIENRQGTRVAFPVTWEWTGAARRLDESASRNLYLHGFAGRRVAEGMSVGAGVSYASLDALDGVDLLYQGSDGVEQDGDVVDFRAGLYGGDEGGDTFELLLCTAVWRCGTTCDGSNGVGFPISSAERSSCASRRSGTRHGRGECTRGTTRRCRTRVGAWAGSSR